MEEGYRNVFDVAPTPAALRDWLERYSRINSALMASLRSRFQGCQIGKVLDEQWSEPIEVAAVWHAIDTSLRQAGTRIDVNLIDKINGKKHSGGVLSWFLRQDGEVVRYGNIYREDSSPEGRMLVGKEIPDDIKTAAFNVRKIVEERVGGFKEPADSASDNFVPVIFLPHLEPGKIILKEVQTTDVFPTGSEGTDSRPIGSILYNQYTCIGPSSNQQLLLMQVTDYRLEEVTSICVLPDALKRHDDFHESMNGGAGLRTIYASLPQELNKKYFS